MKLNGKYVRVFNCKICGEEVITKDKRIKTCSPKCSKVNIIQYQIEYRRRLKNENN